MNISHILEMLGQLYIIAIWCTLYLNLAKGCPDKNVFTTVEQISFKLIIFNVILSV